HTFLQQRNGLISGATETAQPSDPVLVILHCFEAQGIGEVIGELQSFARGQGEKVSTESRALDLALRVPVKKIVIQLIRRTEPRARDAAKAGQRRFGVSEALLDRFKTHVVPAIIGAT